MKVEDFLVLLVEDDPDQVLLMKAALARVNLVNPLQVAADGEEAIAYLAGEGDFADRKKHPLPSLVLLDLKLPKVSGLEVLEWIRKQPQHRNLPVVVLTSSNQGPDIQSAYALGVNSYLLKPIGFADLAELMKSVGMYWMILNKAPEGAGPTARSGDGPSVVILDPDRDFLESVSTAFSRRAPPVGVAGTEVATEALDLLRRDDFIAIVCAKEIPEVSDLSLIGKIKEIRPTIPVLVVASDEDPEFRGRAIEAGAKDVLTRSARLKAFLDRLHAAVLGAGSLSSSIDKSSEKAALRRSGDTEIMGNQVHFQRTSWDLVRSSADPESMEALIKAYWKPLYFFVRQRGLDNETAKDVTQDFLTSLMERGTIAKADPARGRFRTFLLAALTNFMKDRAKEASRQKRGGGKLPLSLDFTRGESDYRLEVAAGEAPERVIDRAWARGLLQYCVEELKGAPSHLKAFALYVAGEPYEAISGQTELSVSAAKAAVHRLKGQFRDIVTAQLRRTASTDEEFEEDLSDFLSILSASSKDAADLLAPSS